MDPRCVVFKVHEAFECEPRTFIIRELAVQARLKTMMPVKVALQRVFTAEGVLSFKRGQRGVADAMQTLERPTLEWRVTSKRDVEIRALQFDFHISSAIGRACRSVILPRLTGVSEDAVLGECTARPGRRRW